MTGDVTVIGAGIVGCAAAAFLAEAGLRVEVLEREAVAAGASGRNSGLLQHPHDAELVALYEESLRHHADVLGALGEPSGALIVTAGDPSGLAGMTLDLAARFPELGANLLEDARSVEPGLAAGLAGLRLDTGHPVAPAAATEAFAARARAAGARFTIAEGSALPDGPVVVCAGPWTGALLPEVPVQALWGVVADVVLADPPRHALEEAGIEALLHPGGPPPALFSLIHAADRNSLGSTFTSQRPDPEALADALRERGAAFLPALRDARVRGTRTCARPASPDGRPTIGRVREDVVVATGHGPWGLSLGPASARLAADVLLGRAEPPPALSPARWTARGGANVREHPL
jgi:D-hydroxyproline dehydrogenase subunit beta